MKSNLACIAVVLLIAAFAWAGNEDAAEAERQQERYCQSVEEGTWPDYNDNYSEVCK